MNIAIKATGMELTPALDQFVTYKLSKLKKYIDESSGEAIAEVEIGKTTEHHKQGEYFKAEINLRVPGQELRRAQVEDTDLYTAIIAARESMVAQIKSQNEKNTTLFRKGARQIKDMMKGL